MLKELKDVIEEIIDEKIKKYVSNQNIPVSYRGVVLSVQNNEEANLPINQVVTVSVEKLSIDKIFPNYTSLLLSEGSIVEVQCPGDNTKYGYINMVIDT